MPALITRAAFCIAFPMSNDFLAVPPAATTALINPIALRNEIRALSALFVLPSAAIASWASRLPALRDALGLSPSEIGMALWCLAVGAMVFFPVSSTVIGRFGGRRCVLVAGAGILLMLLGVGAAPSLLFLILAMAGFGACLGVFDVAINMLASTAEKQAGRSIMSFMHAWFCAGILLGSLFGSLMASLDFSPLPQFSFVVVAMVVVLLLGVRVLPDDLPEVGAERQAFALPKGAVVALGVIGFCAAIAEGSVGDWGGIYLKDQLHAPESVAALVIALFSATMLATRLVADRLKDRFGARLVIVVGALISAAGLILVAVALNVPLTFFGFFLSGLGIAAVFPFVFSAAGAQGRNALISVTTMSYAGGLLGPPLIGVVSDYLGLPAGMLVIAASGLAVAVAAARAKLL
jgi:MFS family permease